MKSFCILLSCCFSLLLSAGGGNAIFNGDFRLGTAGFGVWRLMRPDTNPKLDYLPLAAQDGELRLDNRYGEYFHLRSAEFQLPQDKKVCFRARFQGPAGGRLGFTVLFVQGDKWVTHHKNVTLDGKKQKIEIPFTSGKQNVPYVLVVYPLGKVAPAGMFRFFSFELDGGQEPGLSAAVQTEKTLYTLGGEKTVRATVALRNATNRALAGTLSLDLLDFPGGRVLRRQELPLELPPGNTVRDVELPLERYGAFTATVRWNGQKIRTVDAAFACIGEYRGPVEIDPVETFCVGIDGSALYQKSRGETLGGYVASGITPEERFRHLARMGCRLLRDWGGMYITEWRNIEPEEGKFDFSTFDLVLDMARRNGMQMMTTFGRMYENWLPGQAPFRPDWLQSKLIRIKKNPPGTNPKFVVKVPPMPEWKRYVEAFVRHAGKRLAFYEIMNEPNLNMSPELYMKYMVPAAEIIRKNAPHATILGVCSTGDMRGELVQYLKKCVELGALQYLDGVSFHPYDSRELNSIVPADKRIADLRKIVGGKPLYNTELYFLYDWNDVGDKDGQYNHMKAYHAAWRFLVDLGEGLKTGISINERSLWRDVLHPSIRSYLTEPVPNDVFVAYNALARLFEGAKPVKKIRLSQDVICYVYRKDGRLIAALWNYTGKKGILADLSAFQTVDLFGNPVKPGEKRVAAEPFYLTPGGLSETEFLSKLENLTLRFRQSVLGAPLARRLGNTLFVMLHNESGNVQSGAVGIAGGGLTAVSPVRFELPAKSRRTVEIPVKEVKNNGKATELMIFLNGSRTFRSPLEIVKNQEIGHSFRMENANGRIEFGNGKITLEMTVADATDAGASGERKPWQTDCVELFFDTDPLFLPLIHPQRYTPDTFRLFITPRDSVKLHGMGAVSPAACALDVQQNAEGYSFKLEIPAKTGKQLGFCVKIDDAAGKTVRETTLGSGKALFRDRCSFCIVKERNIR